MRALAASFLLLAAFDLSPVLVDRAGMAALGLACLALALPAKPRRPLRSLYPEDVRDPFEDDHLRGMTNYMDDAAVSG